MLANANIFITGPNGGIGLETVKNLTQRGVKRIALACRTDGKANWTKKEALKTGETKTILEPFGGFDMNNPSLIKEAISKITSREAFDIIFLQAGGMVVANDFQFVELETIRIEKTIYQNVIGAYLTLHYLDQRGLVAPNARIVFPGGEGARGNQRDDKKT